ncbi:MAG TPA: glycosyltransferase [Solirubrobacteraceae bacterium]|nr:glycosyltransferase [Solirubrobacteraceae bacterium]
MSAEPATEPPALAEAPSRARVHGKLFHDGSGPFLLRGVTYGPFAPGPDGHPYDRQQAATDLQQMAAVGVNTIRLYTPPPRWLLDLAGINSLRVIGGLAWEQHVTFLDDRRRATEIVRRVDSQIQEAAGHPALLAWAVGNEIPAPIVRWHGPLAIRRFIRQLSERVRAADPGALVTYVNYPTTEYLELDFVDFLCFNVFLERRAEFVSYLHRLQNLAGDRPLVLTEIGLDSGTHGELGQAESIAWQMEEAFRAACAGAFAFAWTDEWHRGGTEITDWHFGLTRRDRTPKPALQALRQVFSRLPLTPVPAPRVSVLVCTYNGAGTLPETCAALTRLEYPDFEVIVVDDGSTDESAAIAAAHGFSVISTENRGLSSARNTALSAATGEIVAYVDDDAMPEPNWLSHLVEAFVREGFAAVGGPNLPVPGDGMVADAVAIGPGNPVHVLISDREAEHIPGCNAAFRADALRDIGGFDPRFRSAGDDVDVCWRLQDAGGRIGYAAGAVVWHHRRRTVRTYLTQQRGYGRAEALLERKWPARYSAGGHVSWRGRLYGDAAPRHATGALRWRVYHGVWGSAPFQALYEPARGEMNTMLLMPELYLGIGILALLVALGAAWTPLLLLAPVLLGLVAVLAVRGIVAALWPRLPTPGLSTREEVIRRALGAFLHVAQPLVRLQGRLQSGLSPWRRFLHGPTAMPLPARLEQWHEEWVDPLDWLRDLEAAATGAGAVVRRGGDFDNWDLDVRAGALAGARLLATVEEHGGGRQLMRLRCRPEISAGSATLTALLFALTVAAAFDGAPIAALISMLLGLLLAGRLASEVSCAIGLVSSLVESPGSAEVESR